MQKAELLLFRTQANFGLLILELLEHLRTNQRESGLAQDFCDLLERNQELLGWNLEALQQNLNPHSKLILPFLAVLVVLRKLTLDLVTRTKNLALLTQEHRLHCLTIQARSKEHVTGDVLDKGTEGVLRRASLVNGELAAHCIKLLQTRKLLKIGRGTRLLTPQNLEVRMIVLREVLRHVPRNEEHRRDLRALRTFLQNTRTSSLTRRIQIAFGHINSHDT